MAPADPTLLIPIAHAAATWLMTGVILMVAVVHYPLFLEIPDAGFPKVHAAHMRRIALLVGPLMGAELVLAVLLLFPFAGVNAAPALLGLLLLGGIWGVTAAVHVPQHGVLAASNGDPGGIVRTRLVRTNWIRTLLWILRSLLAGYLLVLAA